MITRYGCLALLSALVIGLCHGSSAASTIDEQVGQLLDGLTLEQKIGQMNLRGRGSRGGPVEGIEAKIRAGLVGGLINITDPAQVARLQKLAVSDSPMHIPLLFGRDVIHGQRTIFPIPLGQAATWNVPLVKEGAEWAALEASDQGVNWTFAPMVDISRDARWGRIAESLGEDPHLASVLAVAMVEGFQGDLSQPHHIAATVKHFAAYGAAEGGRDYNSALLSTPVLHNVYLAPFKAAVDAGALTLMSSFNDINGVPASASPLLLRDVLRRDWGFRGMVVSDWNSVTEMIAHGFSADSVMAARQAASAGLDMEMMSTAFEDHLLAAVEAGLVDEAMVNQAAGNVLRTKLKLGLFDRPYRGNPDRAALSEDALNAAIVSAAESLVLLKNSPTDQPLLPLDEGARIALIGPLADAPHDQLGTWTFDSQKDDTQTVLDAFRKKLGDKKLRYAPGTAYSRDQSDIGFAEALAAAKQSEVIVFVAGEEAILSGEAHSRANITLPGAQTALLNQLYELGKPVVLVLMAGRPIELGHHYEKAHAIVMAWHPGTMGGPALAQLLYGEREPIGRLPVTWPKTVGQIPLYYNHTATGRPPEPENFVGEADIPVGAWQSSLSNTSHYLDAGIGPLFPFGFGLSYTNVEYKNLTVRHNSITPSSSVEFSVTVENTGSRPTTEVVQIYVRDQVGSITRPVRQLVDFRRVELEAGASETLAFSIPASRLAFVGANGQRRIEPGRFTLWAAPNAEAGISAEFDVVPATASAGSIVALNPGLEELVDLNAPVEVLATGFTWSEGPVWIDEGQYLLFSDVPNNVIHRWSPSQGLRPWLSPSGCTGEPPCEGSNGLLLDAGGQLIIAQHGDRRMARFTGLMHQPTAAFETLASHYQGKRFNSPNDAAFDAVGNLYFTDPPYGLKGGGESADKELPFQGVYRRGSDGTVTLLVDNLSRPNGIAVSPSQRRVYVANSDPDHAVWMAYNVQLDGSLDKGTLLMDATSSVASKPGLPDGMKLDRQGNLFATGPGGVWIIAPDGTHLGTIELPMAAANCAFGDDGRSLYITATNQLLRVRLKTIGQGFRADG
ncbi:MAG: glycoside hydrolase family 3 N-terminal domain-containing protein [Lysobacterales bacterium]